MNRNGSSLGTDIRVRVKLEMEMMIMKLLLCGDVFRWEVALDSESSPIRANTVCYTVLLPKIFPSVTYVVNYSYL